MPVEKNSGLRIKIARIEKGYSQEALGEKVPCTKQHICRLEKGHCPLSEDIASGIATALGVRKEYLLCKDDFPTASSLESESSRRTRLAFRSINLWSFGIHVYDLKNGDFALIDEENPDNIRVCSVKELETLRETLDVIEETKKTIAMQFMNKSIEIDKKNKELLNQILEERNIQSQQLKNEVLVSATSDTANINYDDFDIPFD